MFELLDRLPTDVRAALASATRAQEFGRGDLVFHAQDPADNLYLLERGRVRVYRIGENAREISLAVHGPGDLFGEEAAEGDPRARFASFAEALEPVRVQVVGARALADLMLAHPTLGVTLSAQLARQLRAVHLRLGEMVFLEVSQRLAAALLKLARETGEPDGQGTRLSGRISHQDLAHLVSSTRETVTKILGDFKAQGLLELGYRKIVLTDLPGLQHEAETRPA